MIQGVAWHYLGLLYFLANPKCYLGVVEKPKFQKVGLIHRTFFTFWLHQNATLPRSRKRCFKWLTLTGHIIFYGISKIRFGEVEKGSVWLNLRKHFRILAVLKNDFGQVKKAMIQGVAWH